MKALLTIWISAVLIQEVVPGTLVRYPRHASNTPSYLHTEYEAKIEQKGKHGNESFGTVSGKQAIEHDNCNDDWNTFANKCASLIKDLVASLANAVSSKPGDATNLQLHIKNTFRHLDNTHNCSCLNHTGHGLSDMDLSHLFDNLTLSTIGPHGDDDDDSDDDDEDGPLTGANQHPTKLGTGKSVNPVDEEDPNSTSNSRRQADHKPYDPSTTNSNDVPHVAQDPDGHTGAFHPFLTTPLPSSEYSTSDTISTIPPLQYTKEHSPLESSSSKKSPDASNNSDNPSSGCSHESGCNPTSEAPLEVEPELTVTPAKHEDSKYTPTPAILPTLEDHPNSEDPEDSQFLKSTENPNHDDESTSDLLGHKTGPKFDDHLGSTTPTEDSIDNQSTLIPVTNTNSNIPESSETTSTYNSLPIGISPSPGDENHNANDSGTGSTTDCEQTTPCDTQTTPCDTQTTPCDEKTSDAGEAVTVPTILHPESSDETGDEILITPKPVVTESHSPKFKNDETVPGKDSYNDGEGTTEAWDTTLQPVHATDEDGSEDPIALPHTSEESQGVTPTTHGNDDEEIVPVTVVKSPVTDDDEQSKDDNEKCTTVTPVEHKGGNDHTDVSESPVLAQPTTFQTTSEDPTHSPASSNPLPDFVSITATTPQDSDENTTESIHDKHHDDDHDDDEEDDCCSCESCSEDEEDEKDGKKVREKVCKSLEEARKELKAIFDKIKKKLRCCRKVSHAITTNSSPQSQ